MKSMRLLFGLLCFLGCCLPGTSKAGGYKITKVIEVGPAAWVPFQGPLHWSPDGTMLAYFANNYLMISDTLGNTREVKKIDMYPHRCKWVSEDQIGVRLKKKISDDSTLLRLVVIDVGSGRERVVQECMRTSLSRFQAADPRHHIPDLMPGRSSYLLKRLRSTHGLNTT